MNRLIGLLAVAAILVLGANALVVEVKDAREKQFKADKIDEGMAFARDVANAFACPDGSCGIQIGRRRWIQPRQPEVEQQVPLPEERIGRYWTTLCLRRDWQSDPNSVKLVTWLNQDPKISALQQTTNFRTLWEDDPRFTADWVKYVGTNFPVLVIQHPTAPGIVVYKCSANAMPESASTMASNIQTAFEKVNTTAYPVQVFNVNDESRIRPFRKPNPDDTPDKPFCPQPAGPKVNPTTGVPLIPDTEKPKVQQVEEEESQPWWIVVVVGLVATGIFIVRQFKDRLPSRR
jgi:hypothetical protein